MGAPVQQGPAHVDRQHDRHTIGRLIVRAIVRTIVRAIVRANDSQARYSLQQCFSNWCFAGRRRYADDQSPVRGRRQEKAQILPIWPKFNHYNIILTDDVQSYIHGFIYTVGLLINRR